jgi:phasin family protein
MLSKLTDQASSTSKSFFDSQLAAFNTLTSITVQITEKIVALNIAAVKASSDDYAAATKDLQTAKNPQEFFVLVSSYAKPITDKLAAYNQHMTDIFSTTKTDFSSFAEAQIAECKTKVNDLLEAITKNAPAGSENAIAMLKSSVTSANDGYEIMSSAAKQTVDTTEAHVAKASADSTEFVKKAVAK